MQQEQNQLNYSCRSKDMTKMLKGCTNDSALAAVQLTTSTRVLARLKLKLVITKQMKILEISINFQAY